MHRLTANTVALIVVLTVFFGTARADDSPGKRRIVGGNPTTIEKHPWQVALNIKNSSGDTFLCGGSLIYKQWILTAAHCFPTVIPSNTKVKAGVTDYKRSGRWRAVKRVILHKSYNFSNYTNDIALIKLKHPIDIDNKTIKTVNLAGSNTPLKNAQTELEVTGWGVTEKGTTSNKLMLAYVPYVDNEKCNAPESYNNSIKDTMLCAGKKKKDACQGDSGGPLVLQQGATGPVLVGVVSFGEGCGKELKYGVYTRVTAYRQWIKNVISKNQN